MIRTLLKKRKDIVLERTYDAPVELVWKAWTDAEMLRQWWGPDKTFVPTCEVDATVGGRIHVVMEAGEEMGKYGPKAKMAAFGMKWGYKASLDKLDGILRHA